MARSAGARSGRTGPAAGAGHDTGRPKDQAHPSCSRCASPLPWAGNGTLESFGVSLEDIRQAWAESMGDPFEAHDRSLAVPPATSHALERARLHATELGDDEVFGEHVLLALTDDWPGSAVAS